MLSRPRWLLHLEGGAIFALALFFYRQGHFGWGLYALLFLAPDVAMLGYLANAKLGSALYNLVHTSVLPIGLLLFALLRTEAGLLPYGLIWVSHIGFDRMLGYGLKYPTQFRDTHLQHV
jgi:hypothetical protein